ncbi:hypothetical protein OG883_37835 [Streptomyces sp. NBC_01142]|uniref:hypothetical protein n=1 Tax=Streptomyces sp. NBC_01142 TaxID=2975865 RepID=UPI002255C1AB|nr:hypothetical protein [Streptomyces sp. NBC_01142]MCX4825518.1 hypothetical protein [Streptomyces sp. NBC_01142]
MTRSGLVLRADAAHIADDVDWPCAGRLGSLLRGNHLLDGRMPWPQTASTTDEEFLVLQDFGRQALASREET